MAERDSSDEHDSRDGGDTSGRTTGLARRDVLEGVGVGGTVAAMAVTSGLAAGQTSTENWDLEDTLRDISGGCITADWPPAMDDRIDFAPDTPEEMGTIPKSGDLIIYVHGLAGEDVGINANGANQARALELALNEQRVDLPVIAGMWSSFTPPIDAVSAGQTFATWLDANANNYDSLTVFGHSMGAIVTSAALQTLHDQGSTATVTSVGLLGGAVPPAELCTIYSDGMEAQVEGTVYNYHSLNDFIVCELSDLGLGHGGIGCEGGTCDGLPANYVDVDLTGIVEGHCNYMKAESMAVEPGTAVPRIVDLQFEDLLGLDRGRVTGTVTDEAGDPVEDLKLAFVDTDGTVVRSIHSDASGNYEVRVPATAYTVDVHDPVLYEAGTTTVEVLPDTTVTADVTITSVNPVVGDSPPGDLNNDGLYRDVNGDGTFDILDVQALHEDLDAPTIQDNASRFDFSGTDTGRVTIFDLQALYSDLSRREELGLE